jgi:cobalt-zinc-cadmium efflux system membrane fusion protein
MSAHLRSCGALRAALCLSLGLGSALLAPALAAEANAEFAVSAAQMKTLGVTLLKLEQPAAIAGMAYAAKVTLPPGQEQVVSAPVAGVVDQLLVGEQQVVKAGQPLLRLNSPQFGEMQLKLLEAASRARLSQKTLQRERALLTEGIIPERRVQEAEAAAQDDAARQRQAEAALRLAGIDAASIQRIAAGGTVQDGVVVRGRAGGVVMGIDIKPGQRVQEADALLRLASLQTLWLDIAMPVDRQPATLLKDNKAAIEIVGRDAAAMPLSVGAMVSDSQTVTLRARVTRGADRLRPGEVVQARVPFAANAAGWALPLQAVARQDDQAYVFLRTDKGFIARPVNVVSSAGASVQVTGELKPGQEVATASVIALKAAWQGKSGGDK